LILLELSLKRRLLAWIPMRGTRPNNFSDAGP